LRIIRVPEARVLNTYISRSVKVENDQRKR
jgi:hypothetical protein